MSNKYGSYVADDINWTILNQNKHIICNLATLYDPY